MHQQNRNNNMSLDRSIVKGVTWNRNCNITACQIKFFHYTTQISRKLLVTGRAMLILLNYPKSFHVCNGKIPYKLAQNFANRQKLNYYSPDVKPHRNRFARQNNAFIRMMIASSYVIRCTVITKVTSQTTKRNSNQNVHKYLTSPLPSRMPHIAIKCAV